MGLCECGATIDDKYIYCFDCVKKKQQANKEVGAVKPVSSIPTDEIVKSLGAINNNLYAIRTILELQIQKDYNYSLQWSAEEKRFLVLKNKKAKK